MVYHDRTIHWSLPPLWIQDMQSLFQQYVAQAGVHLPQPPRPPVRSTLSDKWNSTWRRGSNASPQQVTQLSSYAQGGKPGIDFNKAMGLAQSALDVVNNAQNAQTNTVSGGTGFGSGLQMANDLASNGLMVGQLVGQVGGAAASCSIM